MIYYHICYFRNSFRKTEIIKEKVKSITYDGNNGMQIAIENYTLFLVYDDYFQNSPLFDCRVINLKGSLGGIVSTNFNILNEFLDGYSSKLYGNSFDRRTIETFVKNQHSKILDENFDYTK